MNRSRILASLFVLVAAVVGCDSGGAEDHEVEKPSVDSTSALTAPTNIRVTKLSDTKTMYGTFQSHNQKVVSTRYGIFMTYVYELDHTQGTGTWRLARSIDNGKTFATIFESRTASNAPTLMADSSGTLFVVQSNFTPNATRGAATFYRFDPESSFLNPLAVSIPGGSSGKFTGVYDPYRDVIYYATFWDYPDPNFFILNRNGGVIRATSLTQQGSISRLQYPHLEMGGTNLYYAWTTSPLDPALQLRYRAIQYIYSEDGGYGWRSPRFPGQLLTTPFLGDENGPGLMVNPADELDVQTWLSHFIYKSGTLHFMYWAGQPLARQHYIRMGHASGQRQIDTNPVWKGETISLAQLDGFFATRAEDNTRLYAVGTQSNRVAALSSADAGVTWSDVGVSLPLPTATNVYALSGSRRLSDRGNIIGQMTRQSQTTARSHDVWFVDIPTGVRPSPASDATRVKGVIDPTRIMTDSGSSFAVANVLPTPGDTLAQTTRSRLRLFENGVELKPAHSLHATIRTTGRGAFSHWGNTLFFSSSDNSNPRTNGRRYEYVVEPSREVTYYARLKPSAMSLDQGLAYKIVQEVGTVGSSTSFPSKSRIRLFENGVELGPRDAQHATIRASGGGAYSHWGNTVYFSSSDGTDPRTNGRSYEIAIEPSSVSTEICGELKARNAVSNTGYAWVVTQDVGFAGDSSTAPSQSSLMIYENGVALGTAHAAHTQIRSSGGGTFSHWGNQVYFSASDNTDPRTNGRIYTYSGSCVAPRLDQ